MRILSDLCGLSVSRLYAVAWPPTGDPSPIHWDVSIGLELAQLPDICVLICSDSIETTSPFVAYYSPPDTALDGAVFVSTMKAWSMVDEIDGYGFYHFDLSTQPEFSSIVGHEIMSIDALMLSDDKCLPVGVRLNFLNDYLMAISNLYGSTFESEQFNRLGLIAELGRRGDLEYRRLC